MLSKWTKILPFFFVEWIAKCKCEQFHIVLGGKWLAVLPYKNVIICKQKVEEVG